MEQVKTTSKLTVDAFIVGMIGGAVAALLLSPRSGAENRERVKQSALKAKEKMDSRKGQAKEAIKSVKTKVQSKKDALSSDTEPSESSTENTIQKSRISNSIGSKIADEVNKEADKLS